eukprot:m.344629 g.344629  ORF g.344629 m.344629 type:complete len:155 (+) comp24787_c0_seq1:205-669(+)
MGTIEIRIANLDGDDVKALLQRHALGMQQVSPPGTCHYFDLQALKAAEVTVWTAYLDNDLAGCGAVAELDDTHGELKSMRTHDNHLGKGVGAAILCHILEICRSRGYKRVSLETGSGDPFAAAIHLYKKHGFVECGPFAGYTATEWNRYFTLEL